MAVSYRKLCHLRLKKNSKADLLTIADLSDNSIRNASKDEDFFTKIMTKTRAMLDYVVQNIVDFFLEKVATHLADEE